MKFDILVSCMNKEYMDIVKDLNIKSDCIIINQCNVDNKNKMQIWQNRTCLWINSTERGLSRSRNMAIYNSEADICLLADDDEIFEDDINRKILTAFEKISQADIIIFDISNYHKKLKKEIFKFNRLQLLKVSSVQIAFKRKSIIKNNLKFDIKLGAGTNNGVGEENKFLLDAYDKGLQIYHYPINIALLIDKNESTWFSGYNEEYFYKRGISTRYILGFWLSSAYAVYFLFFKYKRYRNDISVIKAFLNIFKGIIINKLA